MKNRMDSRNRSAFDIVHDLREMGARERARLLAVLGTHHLDASDAADALRSQWSTVVDLIGFEPSRIVTGCGEGGTEKVARLIAKGVTGKLAVVFHRAVFTYGIKHAEEMRDLLIAQESGALLLVMVGKKVCKRARDLFGARMKKTFEIEVG